MPAPHPGPKWHRAVGPVLGTPLHRAAPPCPLPSRRVRNKPRQPRGPISSGVATATHQHPMGTAPQAPRAVWGGDRGHRLAPDGDRAHWMLRTPQWVSQLFGVTLHTTPGRHPDTARGAQPGPALALLNPVLLRRGRWGQWGRASTMAPSHAWRPCRLGGRGGTRRVDKGIKPSVGPPWAPQPPAGLLPAASPRPHAAPPGSGREPPKNQRRANPRRERDGETSKRGAGGR